MSSTSTIPPEFFKAGRTAFRPVIEEGDGPLLSSKFSGRPWLAVNERWPCCPNCQRPMQLFVQLYLPELPTPERERLGDTGLLQLFYCTSSEPLCEVECEAYGPFAKSVVARFIEAPTEEANTTAAGPKEPFAARRIAGWDALPQDLPNWEESDELGFELSDDAYEELDELGAPYSRDKLGGWPFWVQGMEYPDCPRCQTRMAMVMQIDSEDSLPYMFGDMGVGHLTRCPNHPDVLAFAWACY
ncbi:hypothetical protein DL240_03165 [Lujinxingia litoralis]|uniref:DUF1963 domain-containing protein n=1 Tax=Lujinxingia litoralis TaxID=2211119 RepID=A0A328C9S5_9DELT|nr:DUF1963 domain-containing protein [Lujinxingia litoralis]RAL25225.1 hypothetical protein DL240_03165 [Lujinxingia litoralis]